MYNDKRQVAPIKEGEEFDVRIEAVGGKGDGIARKNGFVIFVPDTKANDEVRIRVTKVLPKAGFAQVIGKPKEAIRTNRPSHNVIKKPSDDEIAAKLAVDSEKHDSEDFGEEDDSLPEAESSADTADDLIEEKD